MRRLPRVRVLGATQSSWLPRVSDGWLGLRLAGATGPMDWRHVGPDPVQGDRRVAVTGACRGRFCQGTGPVSRKTAGRMWVWKTNVSPRFNPRVRVLRAQPCPNGNCFPVAESSRKWYFVIGKDRDINNTIAIKLFK
ncbi:hypothetical protein TIFTF001_025283 [Ficus carica]|uniref:Uncharacterized protein n=1 Tax=Ficus carica TaxID=3494 RepID=A0AA88ANY0_FICCA|nr:hypothetical protein TIFTF001_025283 [Ficus carica]